jgi:thiol-disulfide isomerase/thioredoxin
MSIVMSRLRAPLLPRVAVVATALAIVAATCTSGGSTASCGSGPNLLPASPTTLPTLDARAFQQLLCQLHGKPLVVNIWASWCGPCRAEAPELAAAAKANEGKVQFVGVDIQDQLGSGRAFIEEFGWDYPSVFDPTGEIRDYYRLLGAPHTLFFDANGVRTYVSSGPVTQEILTNGIEGAVAHEGTSDSASPGSPVPSPTGS